MSPDRAVRFGIPHAGVSGSALGSAACRITPASDYCSAPGEQPVPIVGRYSRCDAALTPTAENGLAKPNRHPRPARARFVVRLTCTQRGRPSDEPCVRTVRVLDAVLLALSAGDCWLRLVSHYWRWVSRPVRLKNLADL